MGMGEEGVNEEGVCGDGLYGEGVYGNGLYCIVLLWLEPPLADDFCNFLNKIAKIMKIFVGVDLLKSYQPLSQC